MNDSKTDRAMHEALRLLTYRPRSIHEMSMRLQAKGYSEASIAETVAKLEAWGYLNDTEFAENWIRNRLRNKPMGPMRLRSELLAKGVSVDIVEAKLQETFTVVSEYELAYGLAISKLNTSEDWKRIAGLLKRRGFSYDILNSVRQALELANP